MTADSELRVARRGRLGVAGSQIVFIGPMCAGKSTIASLLAEKLELPRLEMDELRCGTSHR
jgi:adenylylsulfate kinase-like enzyme